MKLLLCSKCGTLVQLIRSTQCCQCGNVIGRYLEDNHTIEVAVKDMTCARLIGITNNFLWDGIAHNPMDDGGYFAEQNSSITVIPWHSGDDDVVYADWDEMHGALVEIMRNELFGELSNEDVALDKIGDAVDNGTMSNYDMATMLGCGKDHLSKMFHVFRADFDIEVEE